MHGEWSVQFPKGTVKGLQRNSKETAVGGAGIDDTASDSSVQTATTGSHTVEQLAALIASGIDDASFDSSGSGGGDGSDGGGGSSDGGGGSSSSIGGEGGGTLRLSSPATGGNPAAGKGTVSIGGGGGSGGGGGNGPDVVLIKEENLEYVDTAEAGDTYMPLATTGMGATHTDRLYLICRP